MLVSALYIIIIEKKVQFTYHMGQSIQEWAK